MPKITTMTKRNEELNKNAIQYMDYIIIKNINNKSNNALEVSII
jgi:hypothetical protein